MDLHSSLHCAFLFSCLHSLMLVDSLTSSIHILRGLPFHLLPSINPSMILISKFRLGLLTTWPKNDDLRVAIFFTGVDFFLLDHTLLCSWLYLSRQFLVYCDSTIFLMHLSFLQHLYLLFFLAVILTLLS